MPFHSMFGQPPWLSFGLIGRIDSFPNQFSSCELTHLRSEGADFFFSEDEISEDFQHMMANQEVKTRNFCREKRGN